MMISVCINALSRLWLRAMVFALPFALSFTTPFVGLAHATSSAVLDEPSAAVLTAQTTTVQAAAQVAAQANTIGSAETSASAEPTPIGCYVLDPELQLFYNGDCVDGKAQGQGVAMGLHGAFYQGGFDQGAAQGYGVKLYTNGDAYAGQWDQGYRHGHGVYEYGELSPWRGDKYVGAWHRDQRHGPGSYLFAPTMEAFEAEWDQGDTDTPASPLLQRRQRTAEVLAPVIGQVGAQVCSTLTDGAGPDRVAHGQVVAVHEDRIQVHVDTLEVLQYSSLAFNPRWDPITIWGLCAGEGFAP